MNTDLVAGTVHAAQNTDSEVAMGGCSRNRFSWNSISRVPTRSRTSRFCGCSYTGHIWVSLQHPTASTGIIHNVNHQEFFQLRTTTGCPCQDKHIYLPTEDFRAWEGVLVQAEGSAGMEYWAEATNMRWVQQQNVHTNIYMKSCTKK